MMPATRKKVTGHARRDTSPATPSARDDVPDLMQLARDRAGARDSVTPDHDDLAHLDPFNDAHFDVGDQ